MGKFRNAEGGIVVGGPPPGTPAAEPPPSAAAQAVDFLGARRYRDIIIPRSNIAGKMRLVSRAEEFAVDADTRKFLSLNSFPVDGAAHSSLGAPLAWNFERIVRILHKAIREPANVGRELASLDDYRDLDDDQLDALWAMYEDWRAEIDPVGAGSITEDEFAKMLELAKKKDAAGLMRFGSSKLARFAITSADQPSS